MKILSKLFLIFLLLFLLGCSSEWKDGKYIVKDSNKDPSKKTLYLELPDGGSKTKVENVKMIGKSDSHIIVKTTNNYYWIVEKSNENVTGPMSEDEFKLISFKMRLDDIDLNEL